MRFSIQTGANTMEILRFCIQNAVNTMEMKDSRSGSRGPYHWGGATGQGTYTYTYIIPDDPSVSWESQEFPQREVVRLMGLKTKAKDDDLHGDISN